MPTPMTRRALITAAMILAAPAAYGEPAPPGKARLALIGAGAGSLAAGSAWFFVAGDSLGAGDPASLLMAAGAIGALGATAGAAATTGNETGFDDRASTPPVSISLGTGGTYYYEESAPYPASLSVQPRFWFSDRVRLTLGGAAHTDIGSAIDVDWRPQKSFGTALTADHNGLDLDSEIRIFPAGDLPLDFALRPIVHQRWDHYTYANGDERAVRRTQLVPAAVGIRWFLSGRQCFENFIGPRWDALSWSNQNGSESAPLLSGPIFLDTRYTLDFPHTKPLFGLNATSRARLGYVHSNFDGSGLDVTAAIGFMGPFQASYDLRLRRDLERWGVQFSADATIGTGGGMAVAVGAIPPLKRASR